MFAFTLMSCVDKDFDLGDIDDSEIVFGDEFVAPIGTLELKYSELFNLPSPEMKSNPMVTIPETFENTVAINSGFDQGIIDQLTNSGTQFITAVVTTNLPSITLDVKIHFEGLEEPVVDGEVYATATTLKKEVTKEMLSIIANSKKLLIQFTVVEGNRVVALDPNEKVDIVLNLYRKGGIKLN